LCSTTTTVREMKTARRKTTKGEQFWQMSTDARGRMQKDMPSTTFTRPQQEETDTVWRHVELTAYGRHYGVRNHYSTRGCCRATLALEVPHELCTRVGADGVCLLRHW